MYAGIVVDEYGKVPEHVRKGYEIAVYNLDEGRIERRIPLEGIDKVRFPGWRVTRAALGNNIDYLYTGRRLRLSPLLRIFGTKNEVSPGSDISNIVTKLQTKYQPREKLAPAYTH